ncbi:bifunctional phosphoribosyl-AMP cyclohydrolase/phosphoribosyl-ATP diphosphatase HisIE [Sporosarcina saromensis]|uniref:Histidine biosynthesis bifunctional protein HisIE n=1 Tax=Sporosarcina saromensis TaxID=359365 RepID=A0ABU4G772_9BACL|nr:bifunctional phosphoribosyl-AMP cyclohydrolase/phosphoribosyl-ATP diphosphatase HisIE [Sporosarcina saromensis]MDW0112766.1 bifunctional phosphoribosyl-AMP cyclohydrolase/phosphoribosyl-ATP diphosphatase HisIE [Sporosarcina saromensis]
MDINTLSFNENGLLPAIVQDEQTGEVLMLAYMNKEAIERTLETGEAWFYSRSRQQLWHKGATSGNRQLVKRISLDCDNDTLLLQVEPIGPACHTGEQSCFFQTIQEEQPSVNSVVGEVVREIKERRDNAVKGSYTSYLFQEGVDKILKKIGEETTEVVIAAKNRDKDELANELADLTYHTLVLMELLEVSVEDVKKVLRDRRPKKEVLRVE